MLPLVRTVRRHRRVVVTAELRGRRSRLVVARRIGPPRRCRCRRRCGGCGGCRWPRSRCR